MRLPPLPRLFVAAGTRRGLFALGAAALLCGAAMLPAMQTMASHGASVIDFEGAATVTHSQEIVAEWGSAGKTAMWWQLAIDTPFLIAYGLFLAGASAAVARRARSVGKPRLERAAAIVAWFGPLAAAADVAQNISLALILAGHITQPWPAISAIGGRVTTTLAIGAALFAVAGAFATRPRATEIAPTADDG